MSQSEPTISRQTLADFASGLGSATPSPGSGAAGAVALALAAGCAAKAFSISNRHNGDINLERATDRARVISIVALEAAQRDGDDFRAWLLSHTASTVAALQEDARVLFSLSRELEQLLTDNQGNVIASLEPDVLSAWDLIAAFKAIEARNAAQASMPTGML
jgi:hypothetical protein